MKNIRPDIEFYKHERNIEKNKGLNTQDHEELFNTAKLRCYQENYAEALEYLDKAIRLSPNPNYKVWKETFTVKAWREVPANNSEKKPGLCCDSRDKPSKTIYLLKIVKKLQRLPETIESLWALMEISTTQALKIGFEIEEARHYASKIKDIDNYYGYLAWVYIYMKEKKPYIDILLEIIARYPKMPEVYYLAWNYYYKNKEHKKCKEIAAKAFLRVTDSDYADYSILIYIQLSKSHYNSGNFPNCIELLYTKYIENPTYTVFLYYFCKYCVMSEEFSLIGISKGMLKELLRLCDNSRTGCIYYWISKSYLFYRQFPSAYKYACKALSCLEATNKKKILEMQNVFNQYKPLIDQINNLKTSIKFKEPEEILFTKCEEIKSIHRPSGDLLYAEIMYSLGKVEDAVDHLHIMIGNSRLETLAYFKLLEYDPNSSEDTFKSLLARAQSPEIPSEIWVKATLKYSKYLYKASRFNKVFYILAMLAKVLPPMPYANIPYCLSLQTSQYSKVIDEEKILKQDLSTENNLSTIYDLRNLTKKFTDENTNQDITFTPRLGSRNLGHKKMYSESYDSKISEIAQAINNAESLDVHLKKFCICSKPKFLYYTAKFSVTSKKNKVQGLLALNDYCELLRFEKNKTKAEKRMKKAENIRKLLNSLE